MCVCLCGCVYLKSTEKDIVPPPAGAGVTGESELPY